MEKGKTENKQGVSVVNFDALVSLREICEYFVDDINCCESETVEFCQRAKRGISKNVPKQIVESVMGYVNTDDSEESTRYFELTEEYLAT